MRGRTGRAGGVGRAGTAAALLVVTVALTGCGADATTRTTGATGTGRLTEGLPATASESGASPSSTSRPAPPGATEGPFGADGPDAADAPDPALSGQPTPTLPPGDPGTEGTADDGTADDSPAAAVTAVPAEALLDTATVAAVAASSWTRQDPPAGWCSAPRTVGSDVSRSALLRSDTGRLVESVSAHRTAEGAERAVARTAVRLEACGWRADGDPRLGEASEQLTRTAPDGADQVALVLAADGVGLVLVATGSAAAQGSWEALADLALGSSCLAAADGCH